MDKRIRLNKYLQSQGISSRRGADSLIEAGRVEVDGERASLGAMIEPGVSRVFLDGEEVLCAPKKRILIAVNKPVGIVCTEEEREKDNIIRFLDFPERITYAGRLDKKSEGLLLMTNDGDLIEAITRGRYAHEKEYEVRVDRKIADEALDEMRRGVPILDTVTRPCRIERMGEDAFRIVLTQGLNRQIRRMCEYMGYEVRSLKRVRVMNIRLGDLPAGKWRYVTGDEEKELERMLLENDKRSL